MVQAMMWVKTVTTLVFMPEMSEVCRKAYKLIGVSVLFTGEPSINGFCAIPLNVARILTTYCDNVNLSASPPWVFEVRYWFET